MGTLLSRSVVVIGAVVVTGAVVLVGACGSVGAEGGEDDGVPDVPPGAVVPEQVVVTVDPVVVAVVPSVPFSLRNGKKSQADKTTVSIHTRRSMPIKESVCFMIGVHSVFILV